jgi:hypothetical protein
MSTQQGGASLKHIAESNKLSGQETGPVLPQNFSFPSEVSAPNVGEKKYVIFRLVKKKKGRTWIDGVCDNVPNPEKKNRRERIILLQGADSIWQSDLVELLKDKEYYKRNRRSILFENGICRIPTDDERAIEFMRLTKHNVGKNRTGSGKYDFYEYDPQEEQRARAEKQTFKIKTILAVNEMKPEKVKKLASFLGVSFNDELGMPKGDDGIKADLLTIADTRAEIVQRYMDSNEVEVAWLVRRAIVEAKIDLTAQAGNVLWAQGKGFICKVPSGRKAYEYLTELAMTNSDEGRKFKEQLEQIVT